MNRPRVSVVVLTYDRPRMLERALASIAAQRWRDLEVLVVNNRSRSSDEIARLVASHPQFRLIQVPRNSGFTGGMNLGIAQAAGEYIYLTQEDIELDDACIERLVEAFEGDRSLDLACPLMIDAASGRIRSAGGWFRLDAIFRQADFGAGGERDSFRAARDVTYIPGNMLFARAAALRRSGFFRDDFFMYYDDVELCARAVRASMRLTVQPTAMVANLDPPSSGPSTLVAEFHKIKNLYALYLLHGSLRVLPEFFVRYVFIALLRAPFSTGAWLRLKALGWIVRNLPRLIRERRASVGLAPRRLRSRLAEAM